MGNLYDMFAEKRQQEIEKVAETQNAEVSEEMKLIEKYAAAADDELAQAYGNDYTKEDVISLAARMIEHDAYLAGQYEKVAEAEDAGKIIGDAMFDRFIERLETYVAENSN